MIEVTGVTSTKLISVVKEKRLDTMEFALVKQSAGKCL